MIGQQKLCGQCGFEQLGTLPQHDQHDRNIDAVDESGFEKLRSQHAAAERPNVPA
jgi:hypothetical protein